MVLLVSEREKMTYQEEVNLKYLEISWQNIQHNERLRNTFFNLYLVIAVVFLFVVKNPPQGMPFEKLLFAAAIFVWSFVRLKHMIGRDARIVKKINLILHDKKDLPDVIWNEYEQFYEVLDQKKVLSRASVGWCVTISTLLISAVSISVGSWQLFRFPFPFMFLGVIVAFAINFAILQMFEFLWGAAGHSKNEEVGN